MFLFLFYFLDVILKIEDFLKVCMVCDLWSDLFFVIVGIVIVVIVWLVGGGSVFGVFIIWKVFRI